MAATLHVTFHRRHGVLAWLCMMPFLLIWLMLVLAWEITKWTAMAIVWCIAAVKVWHDAR